MTANQALFVFTVGFLMTFGGVGGIETSTDNVGLITGVLISGVGLLVMWAGTLGMRVLDNR